MRQRDIDSERDTIRAPEKLWSKSLHVVNAPHPHITDARIAYVLENWVFAGTNDDADGNPARVYIGLAPEYNRMIKVVTSMDGKNTIASAHPHRKITRAWVRGDLAYFEDRFRDIEVRQ